jgi:hypothetical protein
VLCAVTIPPADLRSLSLYYYAATAQNTVEDPLKMVVKKDQNMYEFYTYKHVFNILSVLNVEVSVF